jgi:hypothetical protein
MSYSGEQRTATKSMPTAAIKHTSAKHSHSEPLNNDVPVLQIMPQNGVTINQYMYVLYMATCKY